MIQIRMQNSPKEIGLAFKRLGQQMKEHPLTEDDIIKFFSDKENIDTTKSFVNRHPECPYKKYISEE